MTTEWSLSGPGPETYEQYQVPAIFEPLARLLLERIGLSAGQTVLDIACGTGVVARLAAPIVGNSGRVVGIDFNAGMLDVARANTPAKIVNIEWRHGDAGDLPAEDSTFDVVICQQGLQFFPDKAGALGEMRRVLKSGQSAWLAVWQSPDHSPVNQASNAVLGRYLGEQAVHISRAPFALGNPEELRALVSGAGFREIGIEAVTLIRRMPPPEISIPAQLMSLPLGPQIAALDAKIRDAIVSEIGAALTPYFTDSGMEVPQGTHIVSARK